MTSSNESIDYLNFHTLRATDATRKRASELLRPFVKPLTSADVESCTTLENAAFPPAERASREIFQYRLAHCSGLSLGLFSSHVDGDDGDSGTRPDVSRIDTERNVVATTHNQPALIGHVVSTLSTAPVVTDPAMSMPRPLAANDSVTNGSSKTSQADSLPPPGHEPHGRTLCIHSLAIFPQYQRLGLATMLFKSYLERMPAQGVADRAALIAHAQLVPWYETFGFVTLGPSEAQHGGGGWVDMVLEWQH